MAAITFANMVDRLQDEANKGNSISDTILGDCIQDAVLFIERNNTLRYMEKFQRVSPELPVSYPFVFEQPPNIKIIRAIRGVSTEGGYARFHKLKKIEPEDAVNVQAGPISSYWTEAQRFIYLNAIPSQNFQLELITHTYSGGMVGPETPWIFQFGRRAVIGQAMMYLAPFIRSPELIPMYQKQVQEDVRTLLQADDEFYWSGQSNVMRPKTDGEDYYTEGYRWPVTQT